MNLLRCKARLSILWVGMAVGTVSAMFLSLLAPGAIENVMAGEMGGMKLSEGMMAVYALFFIIPLVLAILCLTLNGSANRWLNFIFGIIWVLWFIFEIIGRLTMGEVVPIATWMMIIAGMVISAYIVYFAWKLPKQEA
ncbi:DUF6326 family protein [Chloroflexota bacterium]